MLKFTKDHEWVSVDGDIATCGITHYAQEQLGDVVFVDVPEIGRVVTKGSDAAVVESVKAASDVYAPVSGSVVDANAALAAEPALVNTAPESDGWFFRLKLADKSELDGLMDHDAYQEFLGTL